MAWRNQTGWQVASKDLDGCIANVGINIDVDNIEVDFDVDTNEDVDVNNDVKVEVDVEQYQSGQLIVNRAIGRLVGPVAYLPGSPGWPGCPVR